MSKVMRRATLAVKELTTTTPAVDITGIRDVRIDERRNYVRQRADDEAVGDQVDMGGDGFDVSFECVAEDSGLDSGMYHEFVFTNTEVTRDDSEADHEATVDKTYTLQQGSISRGTDLNTDNPGRVRWTGNFKTLAVA